MVCLLAFWGLSFGAFACVLDSSWGTFACVLDTLCGTFACVLDNSYGAFACVSGFSCGAFACVLNLSCGVFACVLEFSSGAFACVLNSRLACVLDVSYDCCLWPAVRLLAFYIFLCCTFACVFASGLWFGYSIF